MDFPHAGLVISCCNLVIVYVTEIVLGCHAAFLSAIFCQWLVHRRSAHLPQGVREQFVPIIAVPQGSPGELPLFTTVQSSETVCICQHALLQRLE